MSDSFPIPGAWDTMWESPSPAPAPAPPVHTTIGSEILAPVQEAQSRTSTIPTPTPTTQRRTDSIYQGPQLRGPPPPPPPRPPTEIFIPRPTHVPRSRTEDTGMSTDVVEENKPIVIAVFGQTGTGKTSFIKAATGEDLQIGHSLTSCTEYVKAVPCIIDNANVILVDTPGFSDTNLSDTEILKRIATWMGDAYNEGYLLSGIIYLHRIIDPRVEGPSLKNLRMMKKLCGSNSLRNVVLATTMWEKVTEEEGSRREADLKQNFWKDMIDNGSTVSRIMTETGDDAYRLVKSMLKNRPVSTRLQDELHSGMSLIQTEAGTEIREEIAKIEQKLKAEYEESMEELKEAQRRNNQELARQLRAEMALHNQKIARLEAEKEELQNATLPKPLPKVKREGLFGLGGYHCLRCKEKTHHYGRWKCKSCGHQQRNLW